MALMRLLHGRDLVAAVQHRQPSRVGALLAMLEPDRLATFFRERLAEDVVGRGLDAHGVVAGLIVLPLELAGELALARLDHEAEPAAAIERVVDQRHRHAPIAVGREPMFPDLLVERRLRRRHGPIADALGLVGFRVRRPDRMRDRRQIAAALGQHRMADIDVVTKHVRRAVEAVIDHAVLEQDLVAADLGLDAADQVQILAEHGRLLDDALAVERALVAIPDLAVAGEPRGDRRDPAMDRAVDGLAMGVVVVGRVLAVH